jgi:hypothetical protein
MNMTDKLMFVINGSGGKGKDSFVKYCAEILKVRNVSTVDKVKIAGTFLGWDGTKSEFSRAFLSELKLLAVKYFDHSYVYVTTEMEYFQRDQSNIMFIHSREPEEIQRFVDIGCKTILVRNKNVKDITSNMADANVENFNYDYIIDNSGTEKELRVKAHDFIKSLYR